MPRRTGGPCLVVVEVHVVEGDFAARAARAGRAGCRGAAIRGLVASNLGDPLGRARRLRDLAPHLAELAERARREDRVEQELAERAGAHLAASAPNARPSQSTATTLAKTRKMAKAVNSARDSVALAGGREGLLHQRGEAPDGAALQRIGLHGPARRRSPPRRRRKRRQGGPAQSATAAGRSARRRRSAARSPG